jgi:hypothetical protein
MKDNFQLSAIQLLGQLDLSVWLSLIIVRYFASIMFCLFRLSSHSKYFANLLVDNSGINKKEKKNTLERI